MTVFPHLAYRVKQFNRPSAPRPEVGETLPPHRDMLRYDLGFHDPKQPDLIVLPIFQSKHGKTQRGITKGRWDSFMCRLEQTNEECRDVENWITYRSEMDPEPITLAQFMKENGYKIAGWR